MYDTKKVLRNILGDKTSKNDARQDYLTARENYKKNKTPENFERMKEAMKNFNPFEESLALRY